MRAMPSEVQASGQEGSGKGENTPKGKSRTAGLALTPRPRQRLGGEGRFRGMLLFPFGENTCHLLPVHRLSHVKNEPKIIYDDFVIPYHHIVAFFDCG